MHILNRFAFILIVSDQLSEHTIEPMETTKVEEQRPKESNGGAPKKMCRDTFMSKTNELKARVVSSPYGRAAVALSPSSDRKHFSSCKQTTSICAFQTQKVS